MGRRPSNPNSIPRLRARKRGGKVHYYYDRGGKPRHEEPLGSDYGLAVKRWAEIEHDATQTPKVLTFRYVADRYRAEVVPKKAPRTQKDNAVELAKLIDFFDDPPAPLDAIEPVNVYQYMRWRKAPIRATREKALLSHIWNWAREQGYTKLTNPCAGIKGTKAGRTVYIEDSLFQAVWNVASVPVRDAMDLAYLSGQRVADVLKMDERDVREGFLHVTQNKTAERRRIAIEGNLRDLLDRIAARKAGYVIRSTRLIVGLDGQALTAARLRGAFDEARSAANVDKTAFQLRDLRAKAATDKAEKAGSDKAQAQLGHSSVTTTEGYIRNRLGQKVTPTKQCSAIPETPRMGIEFAGSDFRRIAER